VQLRYWRLSDFSMAKLADAPDLGLRNRRFQNVALRFKKQSFYERKTPFFTISVGFTIGE
jgi:hypothetical protein